jgi:hypothetical protein
MLMESASDGTKALYVFPKNPNIINRYRRSRSFTPDEAETSPRGRRHAAQVSSYHLALFDPNWVKLAAHCSKRFMLTV